MGVLAVAARRRPGVAEAAQDAAGTVTTAVQVAEYTERTVNLHRRRTARTYDPWAHHSDHPAVSGTAQRQIY